MAKKVQHDSPTRKKNPDFCCPHWARLRFQGEGEELAVNAALAGFRIMNSAQMLDMTNGISPKERIAEAAEKKAGVKLTPGSLVPLDQDLIICDGCIKEYTDGRGGLTTPEQRRVRNEQEARRKAAEAQLQADADRLAEEVRKAKTARAELVEQK